jgi:threonine dehydrogenase-like Zn-dependent dehydrogenase
VILFAHAVDPNVINDTFNDALAVGAGMIGLCVVIHGVGLFTLRHLMLGESAVERLEQMRPLSVRGTLFTLFVVFALISLHFLEIWLFALLFDFLGAVRTFEAALYVSTASYTTIGVSDAEIAHHWRLVAAIEGLLGFILIGWSTAFFIRLLNRLEDLPQDD